MEKPGRREGRRIVLVLYPFQGHINPMLQLGTMLCSRGFSITVVHPEFNSPDTSKHPDFTFISVEDCLIDEPGDSMTFLSTLNANFQSSFRRLLEQMMKREAENSVVCIVFDVLMYFAQSIAADFKIPAIGVRTTSAASALAFFTYGGNPSRDPRLEGQDTELNFLTKDLPALDLKARNDATLKAQAEVMHSMGQAMRSSTAIIINTMDSLEQTSLAKLRECFSIPIFAAGSFHKYAPESSSSLLKEDTNCISWLNEQAPKSVIYVSFGSIAKTTKNQFLEIAWGLADCALPFLWVVRPGSVEGCEWIEGLPGGFNEMVKERGRIVKWAPQKEVLAHSAVGGFWSHCGWNSTLESICEGIPMLCRPFNAEQCLNARCLCHMWKVGIELENELERGAIKKATRKLMVDNDGKGTRERMLAFKKAAEICVEKEAGLNELIHFLFSL
ncbi:UDP-glucuronosyl/UDP-glucosyltransferase [Dillenia turbinata]|uniref:UDP-glucuronosyl/UDP-glucosyltransferase n=1 Tax=Dillenia turbinata TaxID=194707 RepID=A0AAN8V8Q3_9MAGN